MKMMKNYVHTTRITLMISNLFYVYSISVKHIQNERVFKKLPISYFGKRQDFHWLLTRSFVELCHR